MPSYRLALLAVEEGMEPLLEGDGREFERRYGATIGGSAELLRVVVRMTVDLAARAPRESKWGGFFVVDEERRAVVGMCGYKGGPAADGSVEIAYGTVPELEGRGYATAMAAELTRRALADEAVKTVIAHTLPERNASGRLLEKNGFERVGAVVDPEDGPVWRWELRRKG